MRGTRVRSFALDQVRRLGGIRAGVRVIGRVVSPVQRELYRRTGGRVSLTGRAPVLLLTTVGRRTGLERTVPLLYLREDGLLVVCNVSPAFERTNPWVLNLRAQPHARVQLRREAFPVRARQATREELPTYGHQRKDPKAHDEAGGLNLLRQAQDRQGWQGGRPPTTVEELFRRAAEGEAVAEELVEEECQRIASVIYSISAVVDPETVLLTGGVGANAQLISRTDELVKAEIPFPPNIVRSALGERASLIGAAHYVIELVKAELVESVT